MKIRILEIRCLRCGYIWIPRRKEIRQCAKCKSAYFNVPKDKISSIKIIKKRTKIKKRVC